MSRIKIFSMLFLTLVLGATASFFVYQQWLLSYQETVLKPSMSKNWRASHAAMELFAFRKMQAATQHVLSSPRLLAAFQQSDPKKRHDAVYDELNVLKANSSLKEASLLAATDAQGQAFANAATVHWKEDWKKLRPIQMSLLGQASHGLVMFQEKPHIFVTIPVSLEAGGTPASPTPPTPPSDRPQDRTQDDDPKPPPPTPKPKKRALVPKPKKRALVPAGKCAEGQEYHCPSTCAKREKPKKGEKRGKCLKWVRSKQCACRKKKTGSLFLLSRVRLAQPAPDDRPVAADDAKTSPKPKTASPPNRMGVVVIGFLLGKGLADEIKKNVGLEIEFFSKNNQSFGGTLSGKDRQILQTWLQGKEGISNSIYERNSDKPFRLAFPSQREFISITVPSQREFIAISGPLGKIKEAGVLLLKPLSPTFSLFMQYNVTAFAVIGLGFLLALLLILPGITRVQRSLEEMEVKVLDAYNTGKLEQSFFENAPWILGSFSATLNKFFRQLRGEPDDEDQRPADAMDWGVIARDNSTPPPSSYIPPKQTPLPPTQEHPMVEKSEPVPEPEPQKPLPAPTPAPSESAPSLDKIAYHLQHLEEHYEEVYIQYRDAKEQVGEDTTKLKKDKFIEKLRKNAETYINKYDCKGVLFEVTVKDDKVILKPQLIPKE